MVMGLRTIVACGLPRTGTLSIEVLSCSLYKVRQPVPRQNHPSVRNPARTNNVAGGNTGAAVTIVQSIARSSKSQAAHRCGKQSSSQSRSFL
jgi:hypothetical protein